MIIYKLIFEMPCEAGGFGTNVPGLFKAKAGNLLLNWGWTTEQSPKLGHRLVVGPEFEPWTFGMVTQYHNHSHWQYIGRLILNYVHRGTRKPPSILPSYLAQLWPNLTQLQVSFWFLIGNRIKIKTWLWKHSSEYTESCFQGWFIAGVWTTHSIITIDSPT